MRDERHRSALSLLVTLAFGPGFVAHEYAHAIACRCCGVEVRTGPTLNPTGDAAVLEHDPVSSFRADLAIATAPLVCNSVLAVTAFGAAVTLEGAGSATIASGILSGSLVLVLLGACFGMTAVPSPADTDRLLETARRLPVWAWPVGFPIAGMLRAVTARSAITGVTAFAWTVVLYAAVTGRPPV